VIREHVLGIQFFYRQDIVLIDEFSGELMNEVMPTILGSFVDAGDNLASLLSFSRTFGLLGKFALRLRKRLFFFAKESGIIDKRTIGQRGKLFESNVYPYRLASSRKHSRLDFTNEANVPLVVLTANGASLNLAHNRAMELHLHLAHLGETN
jgi:hypothetical protein